MNIKNCSSVLLENTEYGRIFIATIGDQKSFYGMKGFYKEGGNTVNVVIVLGPSVAGGSINAPHYYHQHLVSDSVLDIDREVHFSFKIALEDINSLSFVRPSPGMIVVTLSNKYLTVLHSKSNLQREFLNLTTGEITDCVDEKKGCLILNWNIMEGDCHSSREILAFPWK